MFTRSFGFTTTFSNATTKCRWKGQSIMFAKMMLDQTHPHMLASTDIWNDRYQADRRRNRSRHMTMFRTKFFTPRRGQVVALLAHTTCLKIGSIMTDCGSVSKRQWRKFVVDCPRSKPHRNRITCKIRRLIPDTLQRDPLSGKSHR